MVDIDELQRWYEEEREARVKEAQEKDRLSARVQYLERQLQEAKTSLAEETRMKDIITDRILGLMGERDWLRQQVSKVVDSVKAGNKEG